MLSLAFTAAAYTPLSSRSVVSSVTRASTPMMAGDKKILSMEQDGLFEAREVNYARPPVKILTRVNELKLATGVAFEVEESKRAKAEATAARQ